MKCPKCTVDKPTEEFYSTKHVCKTCHNEKCKQWQRENREHRNSTVRARYAEEPNRHREYNRNWRNENLEVARESERRSARKNPAAKNSGSARYRAACRIPKSLSQEHKLEIQWYYTTATELSWLCDEPLEVDHIEPLRGTNSTGLHVPWNLQIIPRSANRKKGNKLL